MMILMNSSSTEKASATQLRPGLMRKVAIIFWTCIFMLSFTATAGLADEKGESEDKTVLEDMTVIGTPSKNPAAPVTSQRSGSRKW